MNISRDSVVALVSFLFSQYFHSYVKFVFCLRSQNFYSKEIHRYLFNFLEISNRE